MATDAAPVETAEEALEWLRTLPPRDWDREWQQSVGALWRVEATALALAADPSSLHESVAEAVNDPDFVRLSEGQSVEIHALRQKSLLLDQFSEFAIAVAHSVVECFDGAYGVKAMLQASRGRKRNASSGVGGEVGADGDGDGAGAEGGSNWGPILSPPPAWLNLEESPAHLSWTTHGVLFEMVPLGEAPLRSRALVADAASVQALGRWAAHSLPDKLRAEGEKEQKRVSVLVLVIVPSLPPVLPLALPVACPRSHPRDYTPSTPRSPPLSSGPTSARQWWSP